MTLANITGIHCHLFCVVGNDGQCSAVKATVPGLPQFAAGSLGHFAFCDRLRISYMGTAHLPLIFRHRVWRPQYQDLKYGTWTYAQLLLLFQHARPWVCCTVTTVAPSRSVSAGHYLQATPPRRLLPLFYVAGASIGIRRRTAHCDGLASVTFGWSHISVIPISGCFEASALSADLRSLSASGHLGSIPLCYHFCHFAVIIDAYRTYNALELVRSEHNHIFIVVGIHDT